MTTNLTWLTVRGSSANQTWRTPAWFFAAVDGEFHFTIDVAASADNALCARYFTEADDGLAQDWGRNVCWCNPPFIYKAAWLRKAYEAARGGATVVVLVPNDTDIEAWRDWVLRASEVRFIVGRVPFVGTETGNPHGSALIVFRPDALDRPDGPVVCWVDRDRGLAPARPAAYTLRLFTDGEA